MPIRASERAKYPKDWPAIRASILARAGGRCEFIRDDTGKRCDVPNGLIVQRNGERWHDLDDAYEPDWPDVRIVRIVLTVAHLDHDPANNAEDNLRVGCQLHHLRYDAQHHATNAARTRRAKRGTGELFEAQQELGE